MPKRGFQSRALDFFFGYIWKKKKIEILLLCLKESSQLLPSLRCSIFLKSHFGDLICDGITNPHERYLFLLKGAECISDFFQAS